MIMAVTEAQARRALRRADFTWSPTVRDPRKEWNQVHAHHGLLSVLAAGFACGRIHLRRVEEFSADLGVAARRRLDVGKRVSDSTFYRMLEKQKPDGLRESVQAYVRMLVNAKVITNDLFRLGVMTFDGKKVWTSTTSYVEGAKTSVDENTGVMTASLMSLRAVLTSSQVRPCVDFEVIGDKEAESPAFRVVFPRACEAFGGQFQIVTVDAGMTCRQNAQLVHDAGKYLLASLKGNQPKLHALAEAMFKGCPGGLKKREVEYRDGSFIVRELHTITVTEVPQVDMPGIRQLWRVVQQTFTGDQLVAEEVRYFVSGIPPTLLSPTEQLALVRLHWGIENGHNWTMDVALTEDDVQPCQKSREAIEVVAWLRVLGLNLLAAWRAQAGKKDIQPLSWQRCMELLRDAFVFCTDGVLRAALV